MEIFEQWESNIRGYCRVYPTVFKTAQNATQVDEQGRSYIDFFAGAGVLNFGHNNPKLKRAIIDYLEADGVTFDTDTDTEAVAHLAARELRGGRGVDSWAAQRWRGRRGRRRRSGRSHRRADGRRRGDRLLPDRRGRRKVKRLGWAKAAMPSGLSVSVAQPGAIQKTGPSVSAAMSMASVCRAGPQSSCRRASGRVSAPRTVRSGRVGLRWVRRVRSAVVMGGW